MTKINICHLILPYLFNETLKNPAFLKKYKKNGHIAA